MTNTSVVLGIATLGTPEPPPDCDCATDTAGSKQRDHEFHLFILSIQFGKLFSFSKEHARTLIGQKNYSAKHFMKKSLASINICDCSATSG